MHLYCHTVTLCILNWSFEKLEVENGFIQSVLKYWVELSGIYWIVRDKWAVLFDTVAGDSAALRLALPPGVLAQLLVRVQYLDCDLIACCWQDAQSHLCPFGATFPHKLALILSQAAGELKIIHGFCWLSEQNSLTEQLNSWPELCKRSGKSVYQGDSKLLNYQSCLFPTWASAQRPRNQLSATERGVAEGRISIVLLQALWIQKGEIYTAWWSRWAGCHFNSWKCSHSHFSIISSSIICPEILCLRWKKKSVGAQWRRLSERPWNKRTEPEGVCLFLGGVKLWCVPWGWPFTSSNGESQLSNWVCVYKLPASGWFQPGSGSCWVAECRKNDGRKDLLPLYLEAFL